MTKLWPRFELAMTDIGELHITQKSRNTDLTEPASRKANPPCMKKIIIDIIMRKKLSTLA